ncbi:radical SAM family heme chaperone HemW [bacterium]|nr:radical SAM family heme chaperone HemW [bacterium]
MNKTAGLYVHIPFCPNICGYCDFYTVSLRDSQISNYLDALQSEIKLYAQRHSVKELTFETFYFGGGTPSVLAPSDLASIIEFLEAHFNLVANSEITIEANPGTLDLIKLREYRSAGINRLSLGTQSFQAKELRKLDRDHTVRDSIDCYKAARQAGFDNISLDLIFGLPGQTLIDWRLNLQAALELGSDHISTYNLTYEEGTPFYVKLRQGAFKETSDTTLRQMYLATFEELSQCGYSHYEVSSYARPGFECRHNKKYWDGSPYLGLGVSAHSYFPPRRFWNVRNIAGYSRLLGEGAIPLAGEEILDRETQLCERMILGLRQRRGVSLQEFEESFGSSLIEEFSTPLGNFFARSLNDPALISDLTKGEGYLASEFIKIEEGYLKLTDHGVLMSDSIYAAFL